MSSITDPSMVTAARLPATETVRLRRPVEASRYFACKQIPGRVLALILLVPAAPVLLLLVVVVRLTSPGPGIYRQMRVGLRGKNFTMYKIRTMRQDAEARTGPTWATNNDPRLTRVGRFIRSMHLDELPQLLNVIKGEMDLVGPRPERPEFTQILAREVDGYFDRLAVRPGVTGLAQINLPPDTDLDSVRRKLVLDLDYISTAGPGLDLRILCWTAFRLCGLNGATTRILRLYRPVSLPTDKTAKPVSARDGMAMSDKVASSQNGDGHRPSRKSHKHQPYGVKPR
jgi:lipopolysaccharide/colanic/teichoic acid biosynthesis glycosyltransferase